MSEDEVAYELARLKKRITQLERLEEARELLK